MSEKPAHSETGSPSTPPAGAPPPPRQPAPPPRAPRRKDKSGGGGIAVLALLLALVALAWAGWQWWQARQGDDSARQANSRVEARVTALDKRLASVRDAARAGQDQAGHALDSARAELNQKMDGLSRRVGGLEDAVASLARHRRDGREAALLDQAALLLRLGQQRQELFGDVDGAVKAYTHAEKSLAAADDPELGDVIESVRAERQALRDSRPATRHRALETVARLRRDVETWPLKGEADKQPAATTGSFWQRVWHGLATTVVVRRQDASASARASARMARQLTALDLAQAQAALLAWDADAATRALREAAGRLQHDFDTADAGVQKARADLAGLLKQPMRAGTVHLGKALQALGNLRGVRDAAPATDAGSTRADEDDTGDAAASGADADDAAAHPAAGSAAAPAEATS